MTTGRASSGARRAAWMSDLRIFAIVLVAFVVSDALADGTPRSVLALLIVVVAGLAVRFAGGYRRRRVRGP